MSESVPSVPISKKERRDREQAKMTLWYVTESVLILFTLIFVCGADPFYATLAVWVYSWVVKRLDNIIFELRIQNEDKT